MKFVGLLLIFVIDELMRPLGGFEYSWETREQFDNFHEPSSTLIRLNRFISNAGVCARREADRLIKSGAISVNGIIVRSVGTKVSLDAEVRYRSTILRTEKTRYLLLNKPRGYVSTVRDPEGRRTVLNLIRKRYCPERIYPVGRLDYDSTGLLLLTNDGNLTRKLSHPASEVKKFYHAILNRPLEIKDLQSIRRGLMLEDGIANVDYVTVLEKDPTHVDVVLHMGKNRVIRRIFEHLGYAVVSLDRIRYAHLTKQNVPRGSWIFLKDKDVDKLKKLVNE